MRNILIIFLVKSSSRNAIRKKSVAVTGAALYSNLKRRL